MGSRQVHEASCGRRWNECNEFLDTNTRARCLEIAGRDCDGYRKQH